MDGIRLGKFLAYSVVVLTLISTTYAVEISGLDYTLDSGTLTAAVDGRASSNTNTAITIPDTVSYNSQSYSVTSISADAFRSEGTSLTSITLGNNLTTIGGNAFRSCALSDLVLPASITSLGGEAFRQNDILRIVFLYDFFTVPGSTFDRNFNIAEAYGLGASWNSFNVEGTYTTDYPDLSGANLVNVNFAGLSLSAANLSNADLSQSNLEGVDLSGATLTNTALTGATYDSATQFPTGFDPASHGMTQTTSTPSQQVPLPLWFYSVSLVLLGTVAARQINPLNTSRIKQ